MLMMFNFFLSVFFNKPFFFFFLSLSLFSLGALFGYFPLSNEWASALYVISALINGLVANELKAEGLPLNFFVFIVVFALLLLTCVSILSDAEKVGFMKCEAAYDSCFSLSRGEVESEKRCLSKKNKCIDDNFLSKF
jgi:hypothetical protein